MATDSTFISIASYMYITHRVKKFTDYRKGLLSSAEEVQKGVNSVEGVRGQVYEFPEDEDEEATKESNVPTPKAKDSTPPDGYMFHLSKGGPNEMMDRVAMMGAFDDVFDDLLTTQRYPGESNEMDDAGKPIGNKQANKKAQMLARKPVGIFIDNGKQGGPLDPSTLALVTQLLRQGMIIVPFSDTDENIAGMSEMTGGYIGGKAEAGKYIAEIAKKLKT